MDELKELIEIRDKLRKLSLASWHYAAATFLPEEYERRSPQRQQSQSQNSESLLDQAFLPLKREDRIR